MKEPLERNKECEIIFANLINIFRLNKSSSEQKLMARTTLGRSHRYSHEIVCQIKEL